MADLTWAGLAIFVVVRSSRSAPARGVDHEVTFVVVGAIVAGVVTFVAGRVKSDRYSGILLGAAAGTLFGLVAGLLKLVTVQAQSGLGHALGHWSLWVLIVVGGCAVLLNQRAYQNARLSITAPVLDIAQVLVAITFGILVFGERFDGSMLAFGAEIAGLVLWVSASGNWPRSRPAVRRPTSNRAMLSRAARSRSAATVDLVERDAGRHAGVQRLDLGGDGDGDKGVAGLANQPGQSVALAADHKHQRARRVRPR